MRILVTGATGFVGRHLCQALVEAGHIVSAAVRRSPDPALPAEINVVNVGEIGPDTDWRHMTDGMDAVVHLAARTHVMEETHADPEAEYQRINVEATRRLALGAARSGVGRFVFLSSIKVNGEQTAAHPFSAGDTPAPEDAYGRTKRDAEAELVRATEGTQTETAILRAPLVYGPGVKGNFQKLLEAVDQGKWLPLGSIDNRRSMVYVGNLVSALMAALTSELAAGGTFLVSDGEDVSVTNLLQGIGAALDRPVKLVPVPVTVLKVIGILSGKSAAIKRLAGSLQVDQSDLHDQLGWSPPFSMKEGLEQTAQWFKDRSSQ